MHLHHCSPWGVLCVNDIHCSDRILILCHSDPHVDFHSLDIPVNAVATALKQFFSDLAEPVIPAYHYGELTEAAGV